ncbi:HlyD family efflux transporter periplasmic adaptor subunit [Thermomonas sp.]|uniref:HlyD family secretion protein n=1 Tax=Thermomonas sp. TaxID=1971895 RepID=UPI002487586C|nr:HlyD family efflux transporter periplasmic adaptor subunit [Thermomonas sp.]MDI1251765.1 HlyD family efflux transporter periplasmic adaptor subunit [Thermomonas sp.]
MTCISMRRTELRAAFAACLLLAAAWPAVAGTATVLTGEVQAVDAQTIYTPESNSSPVVIRYFIPEGTQVKKDDVVLRLDPGQSTSQVRELEAQIEQTRARAAKELAELRVKSVDAELALGDADAALATARIDAKIPRELISSLDFDRYQGELDRATREAALKRAEFTDARAAVERRGRDGALEVEKLQVQRDYHALRMLTAEVRADRDGVVVHGFNQGWLEGRIDEGSSTMPGSKAGQVVSGGAMRVRAWALEPDRRNLHVGQDVQLAFDAYPGHAQPGRITAIAGAPDRKPEWGEGRYFTIDIDMRQQGALKLLPGMSVRVTAPSNGQGTGQPTGQPPSTGAAQR